LHENTVGQGGRDQETIPASGAEDRQRQPGVALDEAMRGAEIADLDAHAEDALPAIGGEAGDETGAVRLQQREGGVVISHPDATAAEIIDSSHGMLLDLEAEAGVEGDRRIEV